MRADVDAELALLERLSGRELRERWRKLTDSPVPRVSPALLRLALDYELQVRAYGGLSRGVQQTMDQIAGAKTRTAPALPGMRLVREWQGVAHAAGARVAGRRACGGRR